jgi:hypothetical protein
MLECPFFLFFSQGRANISICQIFVFAPPAFKATEDYHGSMIHEQRERAIAYAAFPERGDRKKQRMIGDDILSRCRRQKGL